jgi:hypothetical protein
MRNHFLADCVEQVLLVGIRREDPVESEGVSIQLYFVGSIKDSLVIAAGLYPDEDLN